MPLDPVSCCLPQGLSGFSMQWVTELPARKCDALPLRCKANLAEGVVANTWARLVHLIGSEVVGTPVKPVAASK